MSDKKIFKAIFKTNEVAIAYIEAKNKEEAIQKVNDGDYDLDNFVSGDIEFVDIEEEKE